MAGSVSQAPRSHRRRRLPSWQAAGMLWFPGILAAFAVLLPVIYLLIYSFGAGTATWTLMMRSTLVETIFRTILLAGAVPVAAALIAVPLAWLTTRTDLPFRRLWAVLTPLPLVIPSYVGAYLFVSTMGPRGTAQQWLEEWFGIAQVPNIYGFPGAVYILTILSYPFILLNVRAALLKMEPAIEEAARSLGRSAWQTFWHITLPQLRPSIMAGGLLVALYALRDFGAVSIMRYNTFTRVIYIQYQSSFDRSAAAVLALVLVLLTLGLLYLENQALGQLRYHHTNLQNTRPPTIIPLGKWRYPALLFCFLIVMAALVMPGINLVYWLIRGLQAGEQISNLWGITRNSIFASALAAGVTLAAAIPVALLKVRYPNRLSWLIERATYIAFALPGIVIALSLVFFGARFVRPLYQTLPMLVFAYLILFLPEAVGAVRSALRQIHPSMEEAARSLGYRPLQVFFRITMPLLRPGMLAGAGLVFLTTMKELPATLILAPLGFKTLSMDVWGAVSEAFFARAAAPALVIILIASLPMAVITLKEHKEP